jgi:hypothetical protein
MSKKDYGTTRNRELKYWQQTDKTRIACRNLGDLQGPKYDKNEIIKKLEQLQRALPYWKIWKDLSAWVNSGKKLTFKQLDAIQNSFKKRFPKSPMSQKQTHFVFRPSNRKKTEFRRAIKIISVPM